MKEPIILAELVGLSPIIQKMALISGLTHCTASYSQISRETLLDLIENAIKKNSPESIQLSEESRAIYVKLVNQVFDALKNQTVTPREFIERAQSQKQLALVEVSDRPSSSEIQVAVGSLINTLREKNGQVTKSELQQQILNAKKERSQRDLSHESKDIYLKVVDQVYLSFGKDTTQVSVKDFISKAQDLVVKEVIGASIFKTKNDSEAYELVEESVSEEPDDNTRERYIRAGEKILKELNSTIERSGASTIPLTLAVQIQGIHENSKLSTESKQFLTKIFQRVFGNKETMTSTEFKNQLSNLVFNKTGHMPDFDYTTDESHVPKAFAARLGDNPSMENIESASKDYFKLLKEDPRRIHFNTGSARDMVVREAVNYIKIVGGDEKSKTEALAQVEKMLEKGMGQYQENKEDNIRDLMGKIREQVEPKGPSFRFNV